MNLKNLDDLVVFLKVVDCKNFSIAARNLNIAPTTVSKQILRLEKALNCTLFERNTRNLKITYEGTAIVELARTAISLLEEVDEVANAGSKELTGSIKISAPIAFGSKYLTYDIAKFRQQNPHVAFELQLTDHIIDLYDKDIDLAIRIGHLADSRLIAKKVAASSRILVASPHYLEKYGTPTLPSQLSQHNCLIFSYPGVIHNQWQLNNKQQSILVEVTGNLCSDNGYVLDAWCSAGLGIALRETWAIADDLKTKRLIRVLPKWQEPLTPINIVRAKREPVPRRISDFSDFLYRQWQGATWNCKSI
ncbi:LysR family transcriptional regulator [Orbus wheelerorum]|uniref:LysR family transcriptional regulator n=1 Tax=Orbus wheelerorum TaxID=3074111 RepID=UPI00370D804D